MAIVLLVIANFSIDSLRFQSIESARANLLGESQITMDRIINDVRLSAGAESNNRWPDSNNANGSFAWSSNASTLVLAEAVVDKNNNIIFADPSKYISEKNDVIYFVSGKTLYKRILASPVANNSLQTTCPKNVATAACPADRQLLTNVTSFTIKYLNGDEQEVAQTDARSVELTIATQTSKFGQNITSSYSTRAVFRNK